MSVRFSILGKIGSERRIIKWPFAVNFKLNNCVVALIRNVIKIDISCSRSRGFQDASQDIGISAAGGFAGLKQIVDMTRCRAMFTIGINGLIESGRAFF